MSANDLMLDVSQAAELKLAFRRTGWNNAEIKTLSEGDILADVLKVIRGQAKIKMNESSGHLIDCDAAPFIPSGNFNWSVEEHKKGGLFKFDPAKISLYMFGEEGHDTNSGHDFRQKLMKKSVINANVLDYLLAHPELIPEDWKGKFIFFWGTIYHDLNDELFVRCLTYLSKWIWCYHSLDEEFDSEAFVALAI
ncbi:MAG: hypothetical protein ACOX0H_01690 [Patescibacteria group bacterium]|jgi:hypothetical protein|nr:hypothetical protein [bacterium]HQC46354.1 hypothetical protein [Candidatus Paceibacterota bacterium]